MATNLTIKYLNESEYADWDRFVDASRNGGVYNQSYFLDGVSKAFDAQFKILTVFRNEELLGGAGLHFKSSPYGDIVQLRPLLYYNGLVIKDFDSKYPSVNESRQTEVMESILNELEGERYASIELSNTFFLNDLRPFFRRNWQLFPRYTYIVPIGDPAKQWEHVDQNLRRLITRCERDGLQLELSDDIEAFYSMYESTYRRKGVQPYITREKFRDFYRTLANHNACQIYFAVMPDGKRAAGEIVLMSKHPMTHTWMAGADADLLRSGASAFLRWKVFEDLHRRGYLYNDLTDAMNSSVAKFKSQFGGRLEASFVVYKVISPKLKMRNRLERVKQLVTGPIRRIFARESQNQDEE